MRLHTSAIVQARVFELLRQGSSRNRVAVIVGLSRSTVQTIAKNGVVVNPLAKRKRAAI